MYTSPSGKRQDVSVPEPGSFHNDDRSLYSVYWPPTTPEQIAAFNRYAAWMVNHFHDRIHYWALWNEQDIGYWNPWGRRSKLGVRTCQPCGAKQASRFWATGSDRTLEKRSSLTGWQRIVFREMYFRRFTPPRP